MRPWLRVVIHFLRNFIWFIQLSRIFMNILRSILYILTQNSEDGLWIINGLLSLKTCSHHHVFFFSYHAHLCKCTLYLNVYMKILCNISDIIKIVHNHFRGKWSMFYGWFLSNWSILAGNYMKVGGITEELAYFCKAEHLILFIIKFRSNIRHW